MTTKWGQFHGYCFEVPATATPAITPPLPLKEIIYKNRMKISYLHLLLFLVSFLSAYGNNFVVTWGDSDSGGDSSDVDFSGGVRTIYTNPNAFAAIMNDGSVVSWGPSSFGVSGVDFSGGVSTIYSTNQAFAALKNDGSVAVSYTHNTLPTKREV